MWHRFTTLYNAENAICGYRWGVLMVKNRFPLGFCTTLRRATSSYTDLLTFTRESKLLVIYPGILLILNHSLIVFWVTPKHVAIFRLRPT